MNRDSHTGQALLAALLLPSCAWAAAREEGTAPPVGAVDGALVSNSLIQTAPLDPGRPLFVPTHPRVATTLRFPGPIGVPEGRGFTEDEGRAPGEYLVSWTRGESHLTVTPLGRAGLMNLNIPYEGETYVVYFHSVPEQFQALACLRLREREGSDESGAAGAEQGRQPGGAAAGKTGAGETARPGESGPSGAPAQAQPGTAVPGRAADAGLHLGLLDKLKLLRALPSDEARARLAPRLGVQWRPPPPVQAPSPAGGEDGESGSLRVLAAHLVRDAERGLFALALRIQNISTKPARPARPLVRCGGASLEPGLGELPALLAPGETAELFLTLLAPAGAPLSLDNDWHVRLDGRSAGEDLP